MLLLVQITPLSTLILLPILVLIVVEEVDLAEVVEEAADIQLRHPLVCFRFRHPASTCWHRFNQQFQSHIPPNFQGFQGFNTAPIDPYHPASPSMMPYGAPYGGYNQHSLGYGSFNNWPRPSAPQRPPSVQFSQPSAMMINAPSTSGSSAWFPDSAASYHVTGDARHIQEMSTFEGPDQIFVGNGQGVPIHSSGSSVFPSPLKPHKTLGLNKLLHVPDTTKNLLSVSQFAKDNTVFFEFHADYCLVKSQNTREVLLRGSVGPDGLYTFPSLSLDSAKCSFPSALFTSSDSTSNTTFSSCNNQMPPISHNLWHQRLGHPNNHSLKLVLQHCNISTTKRKRYFFLLQCLLYR